MAEGNYLCETEDCGNPATAFGLQGTLKLRSCSQHVTSLLSKQMTVHGIDRYDFITTQQDAVLFEERKAGVVKGLGNLAVQETSVDAEYTAALELLESEKGQLQGLIEALFSEFRSRISKRHDEVKRQLAAFGVSLNQYLQCRDNTLVPGAELLCAEMKTKPSFIGAVIAGLSDQVNQAIAKHWSVSSADIESILKSAVFVAPKHPSLIAAAEFHSKASSFFTSNQWKSAEKCYLQAKQLYSSVAPQSLDAAINLADLGLMLVGLQRWSEGEEYCRQARAIFEVTSAQSSKAAGNYGNLGWACYNLGRLSEAGEYCERAKRMLEALQIEDLGTAINLRNFGAVRDEEQRFTEAEELYLQAQRIFEQVAPQSFHAGMNYNNIGLLYYRLRQWKKAEKNCIKATQIYEVEAPRNSLMAGSLYNLGLVYEARGKIEESIAAFQSAAEIYALCDSSMREAAEIQLLRIHAKRSR